MSLRDDIANDLQRKLQDDMRHAMTHYAEMCKLADISNRVAWAGVLSTMARGCIELSQQINMPKDVFLDALGEQWDHYAGPQTPKASKEEMKSDEKATAKITSMR